MAAVRDMMLFAMTMALVAGIFLALSPSPNMELSADVPRQLNPNPHALLKHGADANRIIGQYNACGGNGWIKMVSPELESILCLDKDPYEAEDKDLVSAIFLGIAGGVCIATGTLAVYLLTAFRMPAKRARRVIERDKYKR